MYYRPRRRSRSRTGDLTGGIVLIGLVFAFAFHGFNLPIFFLFLAIAIFVGSLGSLNPRGIYGGIIGAMWMLILALFFITGSWLVFLVGAALSAILSLLMRPLIAILIGTGLFGMASKMNQPQQPLYQQPPQQTPYYQPTSRPQPPYQPYQQGYQPPAQQQQPPETYQEGEQQYYYPSSQQQQYDQPQAHYPQQLPPQEQ